jgi:hypothetical protein
MTLSSQTNDYLGEAEGSIRSAIRGAARCESPLVVSQLAKLLTDIQHVRDFESLHDLLERNVETETD